MEAQQIETQFNQIVGLRKEARDNAVIEITSNLYQYFKQYNYTTITRETLKSLISNIVEEKTQQRIITAILRELQQQGKIQQQESIKRSKPFFRVKPLVTYDKESYFAIMRDNGYYTQYSKYVYSQEKKCPIKKVLGFSVVNARIPDLTEEADLIENKSYKSRKYQGVISEASISQVIARNTYKVRVYKVL